MKYPSSIFIVPLRKKNNTKTKFKNIEIIIYIFEISPKGKGGGGRGRGKKNPKKNPKKKPPKMYDIWVHNNTPSFFSFSSLFDFYYYF